MVAGNMTSPEVEAARAMLTALDIPTGNEEFMRHAATMAKAMSILWVKRGYGQSWRRTGFLGSTLKLDMKVTRLMNLLWFRHVDDIPTEQGTEDAEDTFLDIINYGVFGYQQYMAGEERGPREA